MDLSKVLNNKEEALNRQKKDRQQDWKYYRYKPSSDRIKDIMHSHLEKKKFSEGVSSPRTIYEPAKFSLPCRYEVTHILGKGSYGTVCSVRDKFDPENPYSIAVKKITNIFYREVLLKRAIRELKFMSYFKGHKNIVSLIDLEFVPEKPYDGLYCYQELIDYDLAKVIHSSVQLSEFHIKHFFYQILCGLKFIHSAEVIHHDLKPGNILCTLNGCLKICDFGLARGLASQFFASHVARQDITNYVATRWYRAPELILSHKEYGKPIDMWSVGCILAELYGRKPIFMGKDSLQQVHEIMRVMGNPPKELLVSYGSLRAWNICNDSIYSNQGIEWKLLYPFASEDALDLIDKILLWDMNERLTVEQALSHPFLVEVKCAEDEPSCPLGPFDFSYETRLNSMPRLREFLMSEVLIFKEDRAFCHPAEQGCSKYVPTTPLGKMYV